MTCQEVREHLKALNGQPAPAPADDAAAKHLVECAACAAWYEEQDSRGAGLARALRVEPSDAHWQRHQAAVRAGLNSLERRRTVSRWTWVSTAAAAMLAFAAWAVYSFGNASNNNVAQADPQQPTVNSPPPSAATLSERVAKLQESVRSKQVLDELEQLQISFENAGDADGKSLAEDAELYIERILSIDVQQPEQAREILEGIRQTDISARLAKLRESLSDDAPAPVQDSVTLAQTTLAEAGELSR
jgi:hypothetical protein